MTFASILDSQKPETNIRLHFGVVNNFSVENMLKIYLLRERIRSDVEFNFYNAKRAEEDFKGIHPKGNALCARLLLYLMDKFSIYDHSVFNYIYSSLNFIKNDYLGSC